MRAAKGETRTRIWPAAAALLLVLLAGSWMPAAASIPSPIDPLAAPSPATRPYAEALAAGAEPEPAATAGELPQLAAEPPPATSTNGAAFSLFDRTPCPEPQLEQLAASGASDAGASYRETRVWGFHLAEHTCAWSSGNVSQSRQKGYADASGETALGPLEFGYQGMPRDLETGLLYFRNRYYDPELGRFITADPKGYVDGPSMYAFEDDDPANGSDPMGLFCDADWCKPFKSAAGYVVGQVETILPIDSTYYQVKDAVQTTQRTWAAYKQGGLAAAKRQADAEGERQARHSGEQLLGLIPFVNTFRQGSKVFETYEKEGPFEGGRQLGRTFSSAESDIVITYAVAKTVQSKLAKAPASPEDTAPPSDSEGKAPRRSKLQPDQDAQGPHTTVKRDAATGKVRGYATYRPQTNPRNPSPWELVKRYDAEGESHYNKVTKQEVPTPHVHDPATPGGVRAPHPEEIPP